MSYIGLVTGLILAAICYACGRIGGRLSCRLDLTRADAEHLRCRIAVAQALPALEQLRAFFSGDRHDHPVKEELFNAIDRLGQMTWREGPRYRHLRRGTSYEVLTETAHLNASDPRLLADGELMIVYVDLDSGRICLRHPAEFYDGRFERLGGEPLPWNLPPGLEGRV